MWKKPYSYKEGIVITLGLMLTGALLQLSMGPLNWDILMWPANIVALAIFVLILLVAHIAGRHSYFLSFMTSGKAAVPAIAAAALLTLVMGITRQVGEQSAPADPLGFTKMLESWPFILVYVWMTAIVGEVVIKQISSLKSPVSNLSSLISHLGLFIVLVCGTLGSADMQRLKMYCEQGKPEWRGLDAWNNVHELPLAIELEKFTIDEYPPKLMIIDSDGKPLPQGEPAILEVTDTIRHGSLLGCNITVLRRIDDAMPEALARMAGGMPARMMGQIRMDSLGQSVNKGYVATDAPGSECALLVKSEKGGVGSEKGSVKSGWVTCGSYLFKYQGLALDSGRTLVMATREPQRYASTVVVYTKDGKSRGATIEVNHPLTVGKWKIYQLSYNEQMGKWSTLSVFELVSDPWLPAVYVGILLLALGAIAMFFSRKS